MVATSQRECERRRVSDIEQPELIKGPRKKAAKNEGCREAKFVRPESAQTRRSTRAHKSLNSGSLKPIAIQLRLIDECKCNAYRVGSSPMTGIARVRANEAARYLPAGGLGTRSKITGDKNPAMHSETAL